MVGKIVNIWSYERSRHTRKLSSVLIRVWQLELDLTVLVDISWTSLFWASWHPSFHACSNLKTLHGPDTAINWWLDKKPLVPWWPYQVSWISGSWFKSWYGRQAHRCDNTVSLSLHITRKVGASGVQWIS